MFNRPTKKPAKKPSKKTFNILDVHNIYDDIDGSRIVQYLGPHISMANRNSVATPSEFLLKSSLPNESRTTYSDITSSCLTLVSGASYMRWNSQDTNSGYYVTYYSVSDSSWKGPLLLDGSGTTSGILQNTTDNLVNLKRWSIPNPSETDYKRWLPWPSEGYFPSGLMSWHHCMEVDSDHSYVYDCTGNSDHALTVLEAYTISNKIPVSSRSAFGYSQKTFET